MRFVILLLIALFLAAPAMADNMKPPRKYDRPYKGKMVVHRVERADVWLECSKNGQIPGVTPGIGGCQRFDGLTCLIFIAMLYPDYPPRKIERHERAHCNGWEHE